MPVNPPLTNTGVKTSHSIAIKTANGKTIGLIQSWAPKQSRDVTAIYELNPATSGDPCDNVPGNVKGLDITVNRYDLYSKRMEEAFLDIGRLDFLSDQQAAIEIQEVWTYPDGTHGEAWKYTGVWFKSIGRTSSATDERIVKVDATLTYLRRVPM